MFENIHFHGQFRTYQQKILDNADRYLQDGRIHIVAAPGSGKTILGLELIRRLKSPCIILSPTTTIRNQWGERFIENFSVDGESDEYISYDLTRLSPITSVTYQALYAAMQRAEETEKAKETESAKSADDEIDYASFDFIRKIKRYGIKTVCLDEAHHLQNEWQKALENFLSALNGEVITIALTATPPYDAKPNEWKRYIRVCGEIDEEIFVPELVKQGTLCPHQDYLYFNYPTDAESADFKAYRERAMTATAELLSSGIAEKAYERLTELSDDYDFLYTHTKEIVDFLVLCSEAGIRVDKKIIRSLTAGSRLPFPTEERIEIAVNFLLKSTLLSDEERKICAEIFKRRDVTEHGEVALGLGEKLKKKLVSSVGKLKSIEKIVKSEIEDKKGRLRLLILTDYIKKENLSVIGSGKAPDSVSVVSVFETVRRTGVSVGALSGSLVILPDYCADIIRAQNAEFTLSPLGGTGYSAYDFSADNREKVRIVGELFEKGIINVLVGTKSLLGEGWDAPCVNSLILASFVGSFMLSNQMRGRAIRTDKNQPDKTANIWHLVTVERPYLYAQSLREKLTRLTTENENELISFDFETVSRRFDCFVAPNYETGEIESGISRVTILKPPFDEAGVERINGEMIARSRDSGKLREVWRTAIKKSARLNEVSDVPKERKTPPFLFINIAVAAALFALFSAGLATFISALTRSLSAANAYRYPIAIVALAACVIAAIFLRDYLFAKILTHLNPVRSVRTLSECVLRTMQEINLISDGARVKAEADRQGLFVHVELLNASVHDQNLFHSAIKELLSPIENPRYLLIPRGKFGEYRYQFALACPEVLGTKSEYAERLANKLKRSIGNIEAVYTRTEKGRRLILTCRKDSYITYNDRVLYGRRKRVSRWE
ncbi:MAG: DEAD/DEAH box helicase family protein [Clostridiales bacterium]|nr:DEAD/DEAH box helicase family protein [Clostridiales bacterium]